MSNLLAKKINYRIAHTFVEPKVVDSGAPAKNEQRPRRDINSLLARLKQLIKRVWYDVYTMYTMKLFESNRYCSFVVFVYSFVIRIVIMRGHHFTLTLLLISPDNLHAIECNSRYIERACLFVCQAFTFKPIDRFCLIFLQRYKRPKLCEEGASKATRKTSLT